MTEITHTLLAPFAALAEDARPSLKEAADNVNTMGRLAVVRSLDLGMDMVEEGFVIVLAAVREAFKLVGAKVPPVEQVASIPDNQLMAIFRPQGNVEAEDNMAAMGFRESE